MKLSKCGISSETAIMIELGSHLISDLVVLGKVVKGLGTRKSSLGSDRSCGFKAWRC
jgi:hypothetical protein